MHAPRPMRHRGALLGYFALAFGISWSCALLTARRGAPYAPFVGMLIGPSLSALALTVALDGTDGLRELARRLVRWRVGAWYAALLVAPALLVVVLGGLSLVSPVFTPPIVRAGGGASTVAAALVVGFGAGVFEELGWTGFVTPRLLRARTWLAAGILLGLPWALWHVLPDYLHGARYGRLWSAHMLEWIVALTAYRAFMTWIYSRTNSLLLGILLHASFTGSQSLVWPTAAPPGAELVWYGLFACGLWIVLGVVIARTRPVPSIAASPDEKTRAMPGDPIVPDPFFTVTHAITIDTPPDRLWPWLAQLGATRAGWYSFDAIDNAGEPSAERVLDEYQHVQPGDVLPALPGARDAFVVASVQAPRDLVLTVPGARGPIVSWEHLVEPLPRSRSRLIVRGRVANEWKTMARDAHTAGAEPIFIEKVYRVLGRLPDGLMRAVARTGHRWMEARHMRGIKRRAEAAV